MKTQPAITDKSSSASATGEGKLSAAYIKPYTCFVF